MQRQSEKIHKMVDSARLAASKATDEAKES